MSQVFSNEVLERYDLEKQVNESGVARISLGIHALQIYLNDGRIVQIEPNGQGGYTLFPIQLNKGD